MGSTEGLSLHDQLADHLDSIAAGVPANTALTLVARPEDGPAVVLSDDSLEEAVLAIRRIQRQQRRQKERPPQRQVKADFDPRRA